MLEGKRCPRDAASCWCIILFCLFEYVPVARLRVLRQRWCSELPLIAVYFLRKPRSVLLNQLFVSVALALPLSPHPPQYISHGSYLYEPHSHRSESNTRRVLQAHEKCSPCTPPIYPSRCISIRNPFPRRVKYHVACYCYGGTYYSCWGQRHRFLCTQKNICK